jgi:hypothetical protein
MPIEFQLERARGDRRLYAFGDVGTMRLQGLFGRNATAEAAHQQWTFRRSLWTRTIEAFAVSGEIVGEFRGRLLHSGGTIRWNGREVLLRRSTMWRERYVLEDAGRELARFDVRAWGRFPVSVCVEVPDEVERGLLLFAAFVVRAAADDNSTGAVVASTTATAGGG